MSAFDPKRTLADRPLFELSQISQIRTVISLTVGEVQRSRAVARRRAALRSGVLARGARSAGRSFARGLYDGRYHEREFGCSFCGEVAFVREVVILKFVDRGNEV